MKNENIFCGVDPGLSGAFVCIENDKIKYKLAMPTLTITKANGDSRRILDQQGISSFLSQIPAHTHVVIEEQLAARNQNITATCTTCRNYGILLGALFAAHLFTTEVTVSDWHAYFGITPAREKFSESTKVQAFRICRLRFPVEDFRRSQRSRVFHDGITDATLLALYCQSLFVAQVPSDASHMKKKDVHVNWGTRDRKLGETGK